MALAACAAFCCSKLHDTFRLRSGKAVTAGTTPPRSSDPERRFATLPSKTFRLGALHEGASSDVRRHIRGYYQTATFAIPDESAQRFAHSLIHGVEARALCIDRPLRMLDQMSQKQDSLTSDAKTRRDEAGSDPIKPESATGSLAPPAA